MKIVDMHCDTLSEIWARRRKGKEVHLRENSLQLDLNRMKKRGYLLQNFALFVDLGGCEDPWECVLDQYALYCRELEANRDRIAPVFAYEDVEANEAAGRMSAMLTVEEGAVCGGESAKLQRLYEMGVRMLTLTWNYPNELGHPNLNARRAEQLQVSGEDPQEFLFTPDTEKGLTDRGREFVEEMERLGMIVDVSHLSDRGFYDVLACTQKPFVASHSNARGVGRCVRNLTDHMIRSLGERGGCMGLNYCVDFLMADASQPMGSARDKEDVVRDIMDAAVCHARHISTVGGVDVLGLGSDFDGIEVNEALPGVQSIGKLWDALHKAGFTSGELDKIFAENVLRVYRDILKTGG